VKQTPQAPEEKSFPFAGGARWSNATRLLRSKRRQCVVSTQSNERAEKTASLDRGWSEPSYANARNEQLFMPEIKSTNNDQQEETVRGPYFPASLMPQTSAWIAALERQRTTRKEAIPTGNPRTKIGISRRYR
jgi:hypothetical protein